MLISSETPDGQSGYCEVCKQSFRKDPSWPTNDVPCPRCGTLVFLEPERKKHRFSELFPVERTEPKLSAPTFYLYPPSPPLTRSHAFGWLLSGLLGLALTGLQYGYGALWIMIVAGCILLQEKMMRSLQALSIPHRSSAKAAMLCWSISAMPIAGAWGIFTSVLIWPTDIGSIWGFRTLLIGVASLAAIPLVAALFGASLAILANLALRRLKASDVLHETAS